MRDDITILRLYLWQLGFMSAVIIPIRMMSIDEGSFTFVIGTTDTTF